MNPYSKIILSLIAVFFLSCEDVIDLEVPSVPARLTIEASLDWQKGTPGNNQTIKLSTSTPFFDTTTNSSVTGASVKVINDNNGAEFVFVDQDNGEYTTSGFVPVLNQSYTLEVIYNGENYSATETLTPVVDLSEISQSIETDFGGDILELNIVFNDPAEEENFYLLRVQERGDIIFPDFFNFGDRFSNGNEIPFSYSNEFDPGDTVDIAFFGISENYFNYISILIQQSGGGDIFGVIPVAVRGNCINLDNKDNYAHGYFRLTQVERTSYTFD